MRHLRRAFQRYNKHVAFVESVIFSEEKIACACSVDMASPKRTRANVIAQGQLPTQIHWCVKTKSV